MSLTRQIGWGQREIDLYNARKKALKAMYFAGKTSGNSTAREVGWDQKEINTYALNKVLRSCSSFVGPIKYTGFPRVVTRMIGAIDADNDRFIHSRQMGWSNQQKLYWKTQKLLKRNAKGCA